MLAWRQRIVEAMRTALGERRATAVLLALTVGDDSAIAAADWELFRRTGTTHLHNLLASDPALRYLPYWESIEPIPVPIAPMSIARMPGRNSRRMSAISLSNQ